MGFLYKVFKYKYGIDELYQDVFIRPAVWISEVFNDFLDRRILDGIIEGIGKVALALGSIFRKHIDIPLWNEGMTDGVGGGVRRAGDALRPVQSGRVQMYMVLAVLLVLAASVLFLFFAA